MGTLLAGLLDLQSVERELSLLRQRLKSRTRAVTQQQHHTEQLRTGFSALQDRMLQRRKDSDRLELDMKSNEEQATKLRATLNTTRTNKEYAAILTQLNTLKADNAKVEEEELRIMQEIETIAAEQAKVAKEIETEDAKLAEIRKHSDDEIARLNGLVEQQQVKRNQAAAALPEKALKIFERIASAHDGDAMAAIERQGRRPPYEYVCGGCYMSLMAEHANVLRSKDEIRTCDSCGRILYILNDQPEPVKNED